MKIKGFKCSCCGNDDFYTFVSKKGNHTGLYCSYCGKWLKWASIEEKRLIARNIEELKRGVENE